MSDIRNSQDNTLARERIKFMQRLAEDYELIKQKKHPKFKFVQEFYNANKIKRQNFIKYYNRYKIEHNSDELLPQKRGPKFKNKIPDELEKKIIKLRTSGLNRYEIFSLLKAEHKDIAPSPSTIYNMLKKHGINRLKPKMKEEKRKIIKQKAGELGHIDCHHLPKGMLENDPERYYLVGLIDDASRIAWVDIVKDIKALTVMFSTLGILNQFKSNYDISFEEIMSDNGSEFGSGKKIANTDKHPFERLLFELGIKHRYTRPYRPQTNGKIERFWKTLNDDLLEDYVFGSMKEFEDDLAKYLVYYNEYRAHSSLNGKTPKEFREGCSLF